MPTSLSRRSARLGSMARAWCGGTKRDSPTTCIDHTTIVTASIWRVAVSPALRRSTPGCLWTIKSGQPKSSSSQRRSEFVISRGLRRGLLVSDCGCTQAEILLASGFRGKPRLVNPLSPLTFNVPHSAIARSRSRSAKSQPSASTFRPCGIPSAMSQQRLWRGRNRGSGEGPRNPVPPHRSRVNSPLQRTFGLDDLRRTPRMPDAPSPAGTAGAGSRAERANCQVSIDQIENPDVFL